ncbi:MAG: signal peptidase I [Clostridiales bacterium]|jgi:signal peptidase I|nr:signal peptidase I [Clostridiales bacterium]
MSPRYDTDTRYRDDGDMEPGGGGRGGDLDGGGDDGDGGDSGGGKYFVLREILDWIKHIVIAIVVGILFITFVAQRTVVYGSSMTPTLHNGDQLVIEKISPKTGNINRGDIVTIYVHGRLEEGKDYLIKRVIAIEGDKLAIRDGSVYLNGEALDEGYTSTDYTYGDNFASEITVGKDKVFVMGDNRERGGSNDSRSLGEFDLSTIRGKAIFRWYPFSDFGALH